jgi:glycosyltransferase involved in cell wall biosynthesis
MTVMPLAAEGRFKATQPKARLDAVRNKFGLKKPYIFFAGTLEPRKNLVQLIRSYGELSAKLRDKYDLVLAGKKGWDYDSIFVAIDQLGLTDNVKHLDYVADDDLAELYAAAEVFAFPSLYEGFGLPVLEAMQSGTPTLTSDLSSLPEVGDNSVLYVDPTSDQSVTTGLEKLLTDSALRRKLKASGLKRAKKYSWKRTAEIAAEALRGL